MMQGIPGREGPPGRQGERGKRGHIGPPGERGDRGHIGPPGEKGDRGERGYRGEKGDRGEQGVVANDFSFYRLLVEDVTVVPLVYTPVLSYASNDSKNLTNVTLQYIDDTTVILLQTDTVVAKTFVVANNISCGGVYSIIYPGKATYFEINIRWE